MRVFLWQHYDDPVLTEKRKIIKEANTYCFVNTQNIIFQSKTNRKKAEIFSLIRGPCYSNQIIQLINWIYFIVEKKKKQLSFNITYFLLHKKKEKQH